MQEGSLRPSTRLLLGFGAVMVMSLLSSGVALWKLGTRQDNLTNIPALNADGEIGASSDAPAKGISQVGEAVTQMGRATQQNSALVEESAAAAASLKAQAVSLVEAVSVFTLNGGAARPSSVDTPAAAAVFSAASRANSESR